MKFHPDQPGDQNVVTALDSNSVSVNGRALTRSFLLLPDRLDEGWGPSSFEGLTCEHLAALTVHRCDVILIGTGRRQRFPALALLRPLIEAGRGYEIMDTAAACRTYNVLIGEGRIALAACILETPT